MEKKTTLLFRKVSVLVFGFITAAGGSLIAHPMAGLNLTETKSLAPSRSTVDRGAIDEIQIKGKVIDESGLPLPGVSITVKGSAKGVMTDINGDFSLKVASEKDILVFSMIGFEVREITVGANKNLKVTLKEKVSTLKEVVVVAFGQQKKATVTGAITSINTKELKQSPVANLGNALSGRLPGLVAQQRSGRPGADVPVIQIRGFGTFSGSNAPLVLVDGVERDYSQIDPNEVETVSILKDASATAVFGVRGANGVLLITTRRGQEGKPQVSFSLQSALQTPTKLPKYLDSYNMAVLLNEGLKNDGNAPQYSDEALEKFRTKSDPYLYPDVDWFKEILGDYAPQTQANININGGTKFAKYFVSGSYLIQNGLYKHANFNEYNTNERFQRYNFRSNIDFDITEDFQATLNLAARNENKNEPSAGLSTIFSGISRIRPMAMTAFNPDGSLGAYPNGGSNPIGDISRSGYKNDNKTVFETTVKLSHKLDFITQGLSVKANASYDNGYNYYQTRSRDYATYTYTLDTEGNPLYQLTKKRDTPLNYFNTYQYNKQRVYTELSLNYAKSFDSHDFTALALANTDRVVDAAKWPYSKLGLVGRATYAFKQRYFAEFNMGYNGTDQFAEGRRMGFFPAYSLGWLITEEPWVKNNLSFIDMFKVRASYGKVGNDQISGGRRYLFYPDAYGSKDGYVFGESPTSVGGMGETELGNPIVTWETAAKRNLGFDARFFKDKLGVTLDLFDELRESILLTRRDIPNVVGQPSLPPVNVGVMENKGFELELTHNNRIGKDFTYFVKGNVALARNKVVENTTPNPAYPWLDSKNQPYGQLWGYLSQGFFNSREEILNWAYQGDNIQPGDIKYKDLNGDGQINTDDMAPIGFPLYPEISFGSTLGFNYKGFDMSMLFQGVTNGSSYFEAEAAWEFFNGGKAMEHHLGRWTPENKDKATYPRVTASSDGGKNNYKTSDFWLKDASYLRLKNIELGYTFNQSFVSKLGMSNFRIYVNGANLLTWDKLGWFDPEIRNDDGSRQFRGWQYPLQKVYNVGLSVSFK